MMEGPITVHLEAVGARCFQSAYEADKWSKAQIRMRDQLGKRSVSGDGKKEPGDDNPSAPFGVSKYQWQAYLGPSRTSIFSALSEAKKPLSIAKATERSMTTVQRVMVVAEKFGEVRRAGIVRENNAQIWELC